jgi:pyrroline-5-carboxylate reductase
MSKRIAIIGGGNLGTAIAEGLISSGFIAPQNIIITKRNIATLLPLQEKRIILTSDNNEAVEFADDIILAVKPFQLKDVLLQIKSSLQKKTYHY